MSGFFILQCDVRKSGFSGLVWDQESAGSNPVIATNEFYTFSRSYARRHDRLAHLTVKTQKVTWSYSKDGLCDGLKNRGSQIVTGWLHYPVVELATRLILAQKIPRSNRGWVTIIFLIYGAWSILVMYYTVDVAKRVRFSPCTQFQEISKTNIQSISASLRWKVSCSVGGY